MPLVSAQRSTSRKNAGIGFQERSVNEEISFAAKYCNRRIFLLGSAVLCSVSRSMQDDMGMIGTW